MFSLWRRVPLSEEATLPHCSTKQRITFRKTDHLLFWKRGVVVVGGGGGGTIWIKHKTNAKCSYVELQAPTYLCISDVNFSMENVPCNNLFLWNALGVFCCSVVKHILCNNLLLICTEMWFNAKVCIFLGFVCFSKYRTSKTKTFPVCNLLPYISMFRFLFCFWLKVAY